MKENRNFGHIDANSALVYAANCAIVDGITYSHPTAAMYARNYSIDKARFQLP